MGHCFKILMWATKIREWRRFSLGANLTRFHASYLFHFHVKTVISHT